MKKNAMLKIAAVLLVAVLLTTCAISSTFAKYATSVAAHEETARVAHWGVGAELKVTSKMFSTSYDADDATGSKDVYSTTTVVAPGTSGKMILDYSVTGTPEVALKVVAWGDKDDDTKTDDSFLEVTPALDSQLTWTVNGVPCENASKVNEQIKALFATTYYPEGEAKLNDNDILTIEWVWSFDDADVDNDYDTAGNVIDFFIDLDIVQVGQ